MSGVVGSDEGGSIREYRNVSIDTALRGIPTWLFVVIVPIAAVVAVLVTALVSGDGGGSATGRSAAAADTVYIKNFSFSPNPITVKAGAAITVINEDNTTHTFTANKGSFDTGDLGSGQRGSVTIARVGTYAYHCEIHPFMKATLQVSP
jgi:plastocyanin